MRINLKSIKTKISILMGLIILFSSLFLGILNYKESESLVIEIIKKNNNSELKNISDYYF